MAEELPHVRREKQRQRVQLLQLRSFKVGFINCCCFSLRSEALMAWDADSKEAVLVFMTRCEEAGSISPGKTATH